MALFRRAISLSNNRLQGTIPSSLSQMSLTYVRGTLCAWPNPNPVRCGCRRLDVSSNDLEGSIPAGLSALRSLVYAGDSPRRSVGCCRCRDSFPHLP